LDDFAGVKSHVAFDNRIIDSDLTEQSAALNILQLQIEVQTILKAAEDFHYTWAKVIIICS
jgi:hypothetical protein